MKLRHQAGFGDINLIFGFEL